jgi:hypothetical protein
MNSVTILLQDRRGERLATHYEHGLPYSFSLFTSGMKSLSPLTDGEGVHVGMGEKPSPEHPALG